MSRKPLDRASKPTDESRRSEAVDIMLAAAVLNAQRRLNLHPERAAPVRTRSPRSGLPATPPTATEPGPLAADQQYADQLIELVYAAPEPAGEVPAAS